MAKSRTIIHAEERAELKRLRAAYVTAAKAALAALRANGMTSENFRNAHHEVEAILRRIKNISDAQGTPLAALSEIATKTSDARIT